MAATLLVSLRADLGVSSDAAGTTPQSSDGGGVQHWADQSGNGNHVAQSTSGNKATLKLSQLNGLPAIRFNGSSSFLSSIANLTFGSATSIYVVARPLSGPSTYRRLVSAENYWYLGSDAAGLPSAFYGNGSGWTALGGPPATAGQMPSWTSGRAMAMSCVQTGTRRQLQWDNEVRWNDAHAAGGGTSAWRLGADPSGTVQWWDGDIFEVRIYDGAHSESERQAIAAELCARYGLGFTPPAIVPYAGNPIIPIGAGGSWEDVDVANPDVFHDTPNSRYVMNYSGWDGAQWGTGIATSTDLTTWTKSGSNPVLTPNGGTDGSYIAANGSIAYKSGTYYLIYHATPGGVARLCLATSTDLVTWTRQNSGSPVLALGGSGAWDHGSTFDPALRLLDDGVTFELLYAAEDGSENRGVGRATSTDCVTWTKTGRLFAAGPWTTSSGFGEPGRLDADTLVYDAILDASGSARQVYYARLDGDGYWRYYPAIQGSGSGWDSSQVFDSCAVVVDGLTYYFHAGSTSPGLAENLGATIGLHTDAPPNSYTLTAERGTFALTGRDAALTASRRITAACGTFALTGQPASLRATRLLSAACGSFTLAGQSAGLLKGRTLAAECGSFSLSGQAAILRAARVLAAARGAYTLTGRDAALAYSGAAGPSPVVVRIPISSSRTVRLAVSSSNAATIPISL